MVTFIISTTTKYAKFLVLKLIINCLEIKLLFIKQCRHRTDVGPGNDACPDNSDVPELRVSRHLGIGGVPGLCVSQVWGSPRSGVVPGLRELPELGETQVRGSPSSGGIPDQE